jgi:glycosyltransferase involved in cell wall biosynthesis
MPIQRFIRIKKIGMNNRIEMDNKQAGPGNSIDMDNSTGIRKKRIAVIGVKGLPPFGGAANVVDNLIEQLSGKYDFTIYATASDTHHKGPYKGANQIVMARFPIKALNVFYYYIVSALHAVFTRRYDGVHLHQMDGAFILLLLRMRYKVVATSHGITYTNGKWKKWAYPYFKLNEWFQAHLSSHLTIVSKALTGHYAKMIPETKITYIPNGITPPALVPSTSSSGVSPLSSKVSDSRSETARVSSPSSKVSDSPVKGDYILFAAGRILPIKGLHFLLSALRKNMFKGKLIVLGDLTQHKKYSGEILELAAGLDVEFRGLIKDKTLLNAYIAHARLFIFPSTIEAMSMMLLEVASLRTPVICSDIVQNTDIFDRDEMLFFQSESDKDLAAKLGWALEHPQLMAAFSQRAFNTLNTKYLWSAIASQYENVFERIFKTPIQ